jgi:DnaJ-class molecular chaperone
MNTLREALEKIIEINIYTDVDAALVYKIASEALAKEDTGKAYKGQDWWQLCPKCAGEGQIYKQDVRNDTTALSIGWFTCDLCNGAKVIIRPQSVPPYKDEVLTEVQKEMKEVCGWYEPPKPDEK